jgi:DNA polymerase elongation subunit (family B)
LGRERPTSQFHFDEARTLRAFWKLVRGFNPGRDLFVGHNVMQFDLPFLYKRSMINRVQPTVEVSLARYRRQPVFDTMQVWSGWDSRYYLSLSELGGLLGIGGKAEGMDGRVVYDCISRGEHDRVAKYALQDVELVRAIYEKGS